jgi:ATP-binding cassette subfamily F protein 3
VSHDRELLRALTTRLWVLHDRHVTDFDDNFAAWEQVSTERQHAASVKAAEEESLRRVQERKKTARRGDAGRDERDALRGARRRVDEAEARISSLETRIDELTHTLEDPELYTQTKGPVRATQLGTELERLKRELDLALEHWASASEALDALNTSTP